MEDSVVTVCGSEVCEVLGTGISFRLMENRREAASVMVNSSVLMIAGGDTTVIQNKYGKKSISMPCSDPQTTELVSLKGVKRGPDLTMTENGLIGHSLVMMNKTAVMVLGGMHVMVAATSGPQPGLGMLESDYKKTYFYDLEARTGWVRGPDLVSPTNKARGGVIKDSVTDEKITIVTIGDMPIGDYAATLKSSTFKNSITFIFYYSGVTDCTPNHFIGWSCTQSMIMLMDSTKTHEEWYWDAGPPLPTGIPGLIMKDIVRLMGTAVVWDGYGLILAGGIDVDDSFQRQIFVLKCKPYPSCPYERLNQELEKPRSNALVMVIPDSLASCT